MTHFHCVDEKEEQARLQHMANGTRTTIAILPGASLLKVARMLDEDMSEAPQIVVRTKNRKTVLSGSE
jgi:hypothetical protein